MVDLDLEKFFDRVNHDKLMAAIARRVTDKRVLRLIGAFLKVGVLENGLVSPAEQGTPLVRDRRVSPRQAYRYLQQARRLKQPVPISDTKVAFTVKLSQELVRRVRSFANTTGLSLSEIVSRALLAILKQRRGRG